MKQLKKETNLIKMYKILEQEIIKEIKAIKNNKLNKKSIDIIIILSYITILLEKNNIKRICITK